MKPRTRKTAIKASVVLIALLVSVLFLNSSQAAVFVGGGGGSPAGGTGVYQINNAGAFGPGTLHETGTSRWISSGVSVGGVTPWVVAEWPKTGNTVFVQYQSPGVTDFTVNRNSGTSLAVVQVRELGFPDGTKQTTAIAAAVAGADGAYQVNTGGVLGAGNIHESGGSTFVVDTAGHVLWATFAATGEVVEYWVSGLTKYWARGTTQSWHYDDPAGVTQMAADTTGVTAYHPTGDVRYGTHAMGGVPIPAAGTAGAYQVNAAGFLGAAHFYESATSFWAVNTAGIVVLEIPKAGATPFVVYDPANSGVTLFDIHKGKFQGTTAFKNRSLPCAAINFDGGFYGKTLWGTEITGATTFTAGTFNRPYMATAVATVTLPTAATAGYGAFASFWVRDAEVLSIELDNAEKFNLNGTALAAGNQLDSPGTAGAYIVVIATTDTDGAGTDGYIVLGVSTFVDGGA